MFWRVCIALARLFVPRNDIAVVLHEFLDRLELLDFRQELGAIKAKYSRAGFRNFTIEPLGDSELVDQLELHEKASKRIDDKLEISYDRHVPSYIEYSAAGVRGYICSVPAKEIARLVTGDREKFIFDLNLRRFYGADKGRVNPDIASTCISEAESSKFWFFNNGVTIVCEAGEVIADADSPRLKLTNVQIVNGCQTSMTLQVFDPLFRRAADL